MTRDTECCYAECYAFYRHAESNHAECCYASGVDLVKLFSIFCKLAHLITMSNICHNVKKRSSLLKKSK